MNKIDPSLYLSNQNTSREPKPTIDKDGFLKILMTQLQNQDPTAPMNENEMVQQMATLTSLEQMMNMSKSIELLVNSQVESPVTQYSHLIGKYVTYLSSGEDSETSREETGKVIAVSQRDGIAILELDNKEKVEVTKVSKVSLN
ncbi:flagellar hook assembly protein FlgD [Bacilli bacterium]|uniref:flagellar hook assembly protein FlgD n=1 Tax=Oceanobacillus caeni TaxID=405946 RepID=UPI00062295C6|nr:flagellar basal body rod modification protein FlgD [Bacilli bacterium VT-13-104]PZD88668.1 flagellar hook assembly protein FlgD [Bacilli bacterium]PZD89960.1 flagellar hook assembly protein FlgD [Bacilli bacterium]PZD91964.1 flagellar hook assembly protein FlgD [Bacilli bacterium]RCO06836.1 flagellar hook assembly protein FlgD [Bacilli bacterium]